MVQIPEFPVSFFAQFSWLRVDSIVSDTVVEHENDVIKKRFDIQIIVIF